MQTCKVKMIIDKSSNFINEINFHISIQVSLYSQSKIFIFLRVITKNLVTDLGRVRR